MIAPPSQGSDERELADLALADAAAFRGLRDTTLPAAEKPR